MMIDSDILHAQEVLLMDHQLKAKWMNARERKREREREGEGGSMMSFVVPTVRSTGMALMRSWLWRSLRDYTRTSLHCHRICAQPTDCAKGKRQISAHVRGQQQERFVDLIRIYCVGGALLRCQCSDEFGSI